MVVFNLTMLFQMYRGQYDRPSPELFRHRRGVRRRPTEADKTHQNDHDQVAGKMSPFVKLKINCSLS